MRAATSSTSQCGATTGLHAACKPNAHHPSRATATRPSPSATCSPALPARREEAPTTTLGRATPAVPASKLRKARPVAPLAAGGGGTDKMVVAITGTCLCVCGLWLGGCITHQMAERGETTTCVRTLACMHVHVWCASSLRLHTGRYTQPHPPHTPCATHTRTHARTQARPGWWAPAWCPSSRPRATPCARSRAARSPRAPSCPSRAWRCLGQRTGPRPSRAARAW